jgi:hypothetical protein
VNSHVVGWLRNQRDAARLSSRLGFEPVRLAQRKENPGWKNKNLIEDQGHYVTVTAVSTVNLSVVFS